MQLWASEDQRREANEGPGHEALIESGILRETLSGTSEVYETERVQLADVVPARAPPPQAGGPGEGRARRRPPIPCDPRGRSSMVEQEPSKL